jgi:hypothetical protein
MPLRKKTPADKKIPTLGVCVCVRVCVCVCVCVCITYNTYYITLNQYDSEYITYSTYYIAYISPTT